MAAGLELVVVFWTRWGVHVTVLVSFTVQVALLLLADIRRRKDWVWLKVVIWSLYTLADEAALYALVHMSVLCNWSPEHQLMALWAPMLLVHLGGQDNITAYAIEDNRLWLRRLLRFVLQVAAAGHVLHVSSILSHPSKVRSAAILMFVVGFLKYGERIWALMRADSCCSSSLSATSYSSKVVCRTNDGHQLTYTSVREVIQHSEWGNKFSDAFVSSVETLVMAGSLLDVPKQMFEGPTSYVQTSRVDADRVHEGRNMLDVVEMQLSMMYDLLYTKAAVVHTWYGLSSRVLISLPFTVAALALFRSSSMSHGDRDAAGYKRADVAITNVLLTGAVVLETMSLLRAIFSKWTAILLYGKGWNITGTMVYFVEFVITGMVSLLVRSEKYWSGCMRQHDFFELSFHSGFYRGSKMAEKVGLEDWWDSNFYSMSTQVPEFVIEKVLELVSIPGADITRSPGLNAIRRTIKNNDLVTRIWMEEMKLEESILAWHIATHVYIMWVWKIDHFRYSQFLTHEQGAATEALADYMFYLLASRPYMLPYPVSRLAYLQLCSDVAAHHLDLSRTGNMLLHSILEQKEDLMAGIPLQPTGGIVGRSRQRDRTHEPSMNSTLDKGSQLAAKLIHITVEVEQCEDMITEETQTFSVEVIVNMLLEVWTEMLCYTANLCHENYHAKHLTDGGEIMTIISLFMIYVKNGLIHENPSTSGTAPESRSRS